MNQLGALYINYYVILRVIAELFIQIKKKGKQSHGWWYADGLNKSLYLLSLCTPVSTESTLYYVQRLLCMLEVKFNVFDREKIDFAAYEINLSVSYT